MASSRSPLVLYSHNDDGSIGKRKNGRKEANIIVEVLDDGDSLALFLYILKGVQDTPYKYKNTRYIFMNVYSNENPSSFIINYIKEKCSAHGFLFYGVPIASAYDLKSLGEQLKSPATNVIRPRSSSDEKVAALMKMSAPHIAADDWIERFKYNVYIYSGIVLECTNILLSESQDKLARKVILTTVRGQGPTLPLSTSTCIGVHLSGGRTINITRSLHEVHSTEASFYVSTFLSKHEMSLIPPDGGPSKDKSPSFSSTTDIFLSSLEGQMSSTVSTLCKTSQKIVTGSNGSFPLCKWCPIPFHPSFYDSVLRDARCFDTHTPCHACSSLTKYEHLLPY